MEHSEPGQRHLSPVAHGVDGRRHQRRRRERTEPRDERQRRRPLPGKQDGADDGERGQCHGRRVEAHQHGADGVGREEPPGIVARELGHLAREDHLRRARGKEELRPEERRA